MKELRTKVEIQGSVEEVWKILTDIEHYPEWNPFIPSFQGNLAEGEIVQIEIQPVGKKAMKITPRIKVFEEFKELRWKGKLFIPGIFDGEHIFELSELDDKTTCLIHREQFRGIMVPLLSKMLDENTLEGFKLMNHHLKERCEAGKSEKTD